MSDGELVTNNPAIYVATPVSTNPFGPLYQPYLYSLSVRVAGDGFNITADYLTSPGLVKRVLSDICFVKINNKVLLQFSSTLTDSENPMLSRTGNVFGWPVRKAVWSKGLLDHIARIDIPTDSVKVDNLKKALLGNFGN